MTDCLPGRARTENDAPAFFASCVPGDPEVAANYDVTFTATHVCGQLAEETSTVSVVHIAVPDIDPPAPLELECNGPGGVLDTDPQVASWLDGATGTDSCDDVNTFIDDAPPLFEAGCPPGQTTQVIFTGIDECGNSNFDSSSVTVVDSAPPELNVDPVEACLWPPDHKYVCFDDVSEHAEFSDVCDDTPSLSISCSSNQCDNAPCMQYPGQNGDGNTIDDCIYDAITDTLCVRSERAGNEPAGRTYTVTFTATDSCGLQAEELGMTIHMPHEKPEGVSCLKP